MDMGDATPAAKPLLGLDGAEWYKIIEVAILSLTALLIGFFVARPLIARMFANPTPAAPTAPPQLPAPEAGAVPGQEPAALPSPKAAIDIQRIEGQVRDSSIKKVGEVVSAHPDEALAIIRTWLHEPA
jgi:flagellar M-ring protein FliF